MHSHEAHVPAVLNMSDDFAGCVLVYLDKRKVKSQCRLKSNEIVGSSEFFSELCIRAEIKPELLTGKQNCEKEKFWLYYQRSLSA